MLILTSIPVNEWHSPSVRFTRLVFLEACQKDTGALSHGALIKTVGASLRFTLYYTHTPNALPFPDRFYPDPEKTKNLRDLRAFAVQTL